MTLAQCPWISIQSVRRRTEIYYYKLNLLIVTVVSLKLDVF